jgi:hypothetical protein
MMTTLLKTNDHDGLCNRLFPFAHLLAHARQCGDVVSHHSFGQFAQWFAGTSGSAIPSESQRTAKPQRQTYLPANSWLIKWHKLRRRLGADAAVMLPNGFEASLRADWLQALKQNHKYVQLSGLYFHDFVAFEEQTDWLRRFFSLAEPHRSQVEAFLQDVHRRGDVHIGVHIRRGDYARHDGGSMFYSWNDYAELLQQIATLFPSHQKLVFVLSSDEPIDTAAFAGLHILTTPGSAVLDLYSLAGCDFLVGPDSTFSEWASFMGQVPRYVHRRKPLEQHGLPWAPPLLSDFHVHRRGFSRCCPEHPGRLQTYTP